MTKSLLTFCGAHLCQRQVCFSYRNKTKITKHKYKLPKNSLLWALVSVTFVEFCLVAPLLINQNDDAQNNNFSADSKERPQGGKLV